MSKRTNTFNYDAKMVLFDRYTLDSYWSLTKCRKYGNKNDRKLHVANQCSSSRRYQNKINRTRQGALSHIITIVNGVHVYGLSIGKMQFIITCTHLKGPRRIILYIKIYYASHLSVFVFKGGDTYKQKRTVARIVAFCDGGRFVAKKWVVSGLSSLRFMSPARTVI